MTLGEATLSIKPEMQEREVTKLKKTIDGISKGMKGIGGGIKNSFLTAASGLQILSSVIAGLDAQISNLKSTAEFAGEFSQLATAGGMSEGQLVGLQSLFIEAGAGNIEQVNTIFKKFMLQADKGDIIVDSNKNMAENFLNYLNEIAHMDTPQKREAITATFGKQAVGAAEMVEAMPDIAKKLENISAEELNFFRKTGQNMASFDEALDTADAVKFMAELRRVNTLAEKGMTGDIVQQAEARGAFEEKKAQTYQLGDLTMSENQKIGIEELTFKTFQAQLAIARSIDEIIKEGGGTLKGMAKIFVDEMVKALGLDKLFRDLIDKMSFWRPTR